jgi:hypothetical protein
MEWCKNGRGRGRGMGERWGCEDGVRLEEVGGIDGRLAGILDTKVYYIRGKGRWIECIV